MKALHRGRFLSLLVDDGWEYCERTNARGVVTVVAVTNDDELLLTEQYRPPVGRSVIELPAGLVGDEPGSEDEARASAAQRELIEETGYRAGGLVHLGRGPSSAGLSSEIIDFYLARGIERVGDGGGTESESITVHRVSLDDIAHWLQVRLDRGELIDFKVQAGLWWLEQRRRRPDDTVETPPQ